MNSKNYLFKLHAAVLALFVSILACSVPPYSSVPTVPSPYDIYVATTGNDANTCRTLAQACRTVTGGVGRAVAGSTIIVGAGTFTERSVVHVSIPLTIRGAGQASTIISSAGGGVFQILSAAGYPAEVHMQDLAIANFVATNHVAVFNAASTLLMTRVTIRNNAHAGLMNFGGTVMLNDCEISDNGDVGIFSNAVLQVTHSVLRRNANTAISNSGVAVIEGMSLLEQNRPEAILNSKTTDVSGDHPGTLTITSSTISNNAGTGVINQGGHVTVNLSAIDTNAGTGLINADGVLLLGNSEVAHNQGRGVDIEDINPPLDSVAEITQTAFIMNTASSLFLGNGVARLTNVTASGNTAGIRIAHGNLTLAYSTIARNTLWGVQLDNSDASANLQNSIVALNAPGSDCVSGSGGPITQDGASLACNATLTNDYLLLGDLDLANGTQIHPLQTGSPAIDRASGACPAVDQRGYRRPYGRACDVGAYEFGAGLHLEAETPGIIEILPSETPTASVTPTLGAITVVLIQNANCRKGPGTVYETLTSFLSGQSLQVDGRNEMAPWWWRVALPNSSQHCWVSSVAGTLQGDPNQLTIIPAPPTPTITPEAGGIDFDKDGYTSDKDCDDKNAKVHPGAPETPDDKVDSNCNGKDNS